MVTIDEIAKISEDRKIQEHQELALLVAYTQDEFIRANGTDHGVAQVVADAIQEAGFAREHQLSEDELEILRTALQIAIGRSKQTVRSGSYRRTRNRQDRAESARARRYRVLLEKLGGPKIPVAPVAEEDQTPGITQKPVDSTQLPEHSDYARDEIKAAGTAAEAFWTVLYDRTGTDDGSEHFAHWEPFGVRDAEDTSLEYGVANFGDLEDVLTESDTERTTLKWARSMLQPSYGDLLVARPWTPPEIAA